MRPASLPERSQGTPTSAAHSRSSRLLCLIPSGLAHLAGQRPSEIRLVRPWHSGILSRIPLDVFGANRFRPVAEAAPISYRRGPWRREGAFIVDGEVELKVLAPVVWRWVGAPILFRVPFPSFLCGFVIDEPISFDYVQSLRVRRAVPVHRGKGSDLDPHGVYDQRVAFVMTHGFAIPGRRHLGRMRLVQTHVTNLMIVVIEDDDLVGLLQDLNGTTRKNKRHPCGPTLVTRARKAHTG